MSRKLCNKVGQSKLILLQVHFVSVLCDTETYRKAKTLIYKGCESCTEESVGTCNMRPHSNETYHTTPDGYRNHQQEGYSTCSEYGLRGSCFQLSCGLLQAFCEKLTKPYHGRKFRKTIHHLSWGYLKCLSMRSIRH